MIWRLHEHESIYRGVPLPRAIEAGRQAELELSSRLLHSLEEIFVVCGKQGCQRVRPVVIQALPLTFAGQAKTLGGLAPPGPLFDPRKSGPGAGLNKDLKRT